MSGDRLLRAVGFLERVKFSSADEDRVGGGGSPFVVGEALVLAEVLLPRLADHEGASAGLLRDPVVVAGVLERLAVLYPSVPVGRRYRVRGIRGNIVYVRAEVYFGLKIKNRSLSFIGFLRSVYTKR